MAKIEVLHHKSMKRVLGIAIGEVKEEETIKKEVRRRFGGFVTIKEV